MNFFDQAVEKAYSLLKKRLTHDSDVNAGLKARPIFAFKGGNAFIDLLFDNTNCTYDSGICDANLKPIPKTFLKTVFPKHGSKPFCTLRTCTWVPNIMFKRVWLETALGHTLYMMWNRGKPFLFKHETIESLAIEYDVT